MPPDPHVKFGVAAVVGRPVPYPNAMTDPQFLVIRRSGEPPAEGAGAFSIPGGWLEDGETIAEAACREVEEETGIRCSTLGAGSRATIVTHRSETTGLWCVTGYVGVHALADGPLVPEPGKVSELRWMTHGEFHRECSDNLFTPLRLAIEAGLLHRS